MGNVVFNQKLVFKYHFTKLLFAIIMFTSSHFLNRSPWLWHKSSPAEC